MVIGPNINNDPFRKQSDEFSHFVSEAKKNNDFKMSYLLEASKLKNSADSLKNPDLFDYNKLLDEEVYGHVSRRLNEIIETIRHHIHKKEYDKATLYLNDMRILGDFIKEKNVKFDFEFYNKIERFFDKKKQKDISLIPLFKKLSR